VEEKHRLWVGSTISAYAQTIATSAPDAIVTLGVLLYLIAHRAYSGPRRGWTQVPIQYMATRGQMRFDRIKKALVWLNEQKMIISSRTNIYQFRAGWYKVSPVILRQPTFNVDEQKQVRQRILKATPKVAAEGPGTKVVFWSPLSQTVEWEIVSSEYANSLSKCKQCENWFDPTMGRHPTNSVLCVACYVKSIVKPGVPARLILEFGEYEWSAIQVDEFLGKV